MSKLILAALAASLAAPVAFAGHRYDDDDRGGNIEYAKVVSVQPIYREVEVRAPREHCWDEPVEYREHHDPAAGNQAAGVVLGAMAGGVAGHQFGQGHGRDAGTVIGAIIGASIGSQVARDDAPPPYETVRTGYEERCETVRERHVEQHVEGYDVTYRYHGRLYNTRMPYDPGDRIPVQVDVQPVSY